MIWNNNTACQYNQNKLTCLVCFAHTIWKSSRISGHVDFENRFWKEGNVFHSSKTETL